MLALFDFCFHRIPFVRSWFSVPAPPPGLYRAHRIRITPGILLRLGSWPLAGLAIHYARASARAIAHAVFPHCALGQILGAVPAD